MHAFAELRMTSAQPCANQLERGSVHASSWKDCDTPESSAAVAVPPQCRCHSTLADPEPDQLAAARDHPSAQQAMQWPGGAGATVSGHFLRMHEAGVCAATPARERNNRTWQKQQADAWHRLWSSLPLGPLRILKH